MKKLILTICFIFLLAGCSNQQQTNLKEDDKKPNIASSNIETKDETIKFLEYYLAENFRLDMIGQNIVMSESERAQYLNSEEKDNFSILHFKSKNGFNEYVDDYVTLTKSGLFFGKPQTIKEISVELNNKDNLANKDNKIELIRKYIHKIDTFGNRDISVSYVNSLEENDYTILNFVIKNNRFNRFKDELERSASSDSIDYSLFTDRQIFVSKDLNYVFSTWGGAKDIETLKTELEEKKKMFKN